MTRRQQIKALHMQGMTPYDIAREMKESQDVINGMLSKLRAHHEIGATKRVFAEPKSSERVNIRLTERTIERISAEAKSREVPFSRLIRDLIETIARDNMVSAVLDDGR